MTNPAIPPCDAEAGGGGVFERVAPNIPRWWAYTKSGRRKAAVLRFIVGYVEHHGYGPSYADIAAGTGLVSQGYVCALIGQLERGGHIRRLPKRARGLKVLHPVAIPRSPMGEPLYWVEVAA